MAKKNEHFASAAVLVRADNNGFGANLISPYINGSSTKQEQQIADKTHQHLLIMDGHRRKTDFAINEMSRLHQHGSSEFFNVASHVADLSEQAAGKPYEAVVQAFNKLNTESAGNHILGAMNVGARIIAEVIDDPIDVLPVEEKKGWSLFGW